LPHVEKLYQRFKDSKDIRIVTFNIDDNVGLLGEFMKENKYSFPVLPARFLVESLVPRLIIPQNWIVDASGVMRFESLGFGSDGEKWEELVVQTMEKVRGPK